MLFVLETKIFQSIDKSIMMRWRKLLIKENILDFRHSNEVKKNDQLSVGNWTLFSNTILVSKLQNETHAVREQAELKISRDHWLHEQQRLNQQFRKYDQEHRTWLSDAFHDPDYLSLFHEITRFRIWLEERTIEFRKTTVLPIVQLK